MGNEDQNSQGLNPAWKPLLDAIPDSFHGLITPHLAEWDKGVQQKLQDVRGEYAPYQQLVDAKINPQIIADSLTLWNEFANDPQKVIKEAIEAYELPYVDPATVQTQQQSNLDEFDLGDGVDVDTLLSHPRFKELTSQLEAIKSRDEEREQAELTAQAVQQHKNWLDEMQKPDKYGEFDTTYVTALMSQGVDGEEAIKRYQQLVAGVVGNNLNNGEQQNQQQNNGETPIVMGGSGTAGSGLPDGQVDFNKMKSSEFEGAVEALLQASLNNNQG